MLITGVNVCQLSGFMEISGEMLFVQQSLSQSGAFIYKTRK